MRIERKIDNLTPFNIINLYLKSYVIVMCMNSINYYERNYEVFLGRNYVLIKKLEILYIGWKK